MRLRLDLDNPVRNGRNVLIHGSPNAGKTYTAGAAIKAAQAAGGKGFFININGEDGTRSLQSLGLGSVAETVETTKDLQELIKELAKEELSTVVLDSVKYIWGLAITSVCGVGKSPSVGGKSNQWGDIHSLGTELVQSIKDLAPEVIMLCPSDRSLDQVKETITLTPDVPGRMAAGIAGLFDAVGYLDAAVVGSNVRRTLNFQPMMGVVTRLRSAQQLKKGIVLTEGADVWAEVVKSLEEVGG